MWRRNKATWVCEIVLCHQHVPPQAMAAVRSNQHFTKYAEAEQPEDWDEEEDGEWEPPRITNPKCEDGPGCGEWEAPTIPNPNYKGTWYPPMIDNPEYKVSCAYCACFQYPAMRIRMAYSQWPACVKPVLGTCATAVCHTSQGCCPDSLLGRTHKAAFLLHKHCGVDLFIQWELLYSNTSHPCRESGSQARLLTLTTLRTSSPLTTWVTLELWQ